MKKIVIFLIKLYQKTISPDQGFIKDVGITTTLRCAFYPTCSEYAIQAVMKYGAIKGLLLSVHRIFRCHPWQRKHLDPLV
ncbi:MAG: membrane protein insertion efficiency factor YidD [Patescibacteria group bacterium]